MKSLSKRLERHFSEEKKLHWHIDYLLASRYVKLVETRIYYSDKKEECRINLETLKDAVFVPVEGFGSSDCKKCPAHLLFMGQLFA